MIDWGTEMASAGLNSGQRPVTAAAAIFVGMSSAFIGACFCLISGGGLLMSFLVYVVVGAAATVGYALLATTLMSRQPRIARADEPVLARVPATAQVKHPPRPSQPLRRAGGAEFR